MTAPAGDRLSLAEAALALALGIVVLIGLAPITAPLGLAGVAIAQVAAFAAPALLIASRGGAPLRRLGLVAPAPRALAGAALIGASYWILVWLLVAPLFERFGADDSVRALERLVVATGIHPALVIACLAAVPAVCEELLHRGAVARALEGALGRPAAVIVSALIFAAAHLSWIRLAPTMLFGALLAWAALASRSLWPAIAMHFLNNAAALTLALAGGAEPARRFGLALAGLAAVTTGAGLMLIRSAARSRK